VLKYVIETIQEVTKPETLAEMVNKLDSSGYHLLRSPIQLGLAGFRLLLRCGADLGDSKSPSGETASEIFLRSKEWLDNWVPMQRLLDIRRIVRKHPKQPFAHIWSLSNGNMKFHEYTYETLEHMNREMLRARRDWKHPITIGLNSRDIHWIHILSTNVSYCLVWIHTS